MTPALTNPVLKILVGTMTGTAEMVAQAVQDRQAELGGVADILPMDRLDHAVFTPDHLYLICTSTYGQGDVPDNARDFFAAIDAARPDLSAVRFGLIALGDRTYQQTFCHGGQRFEALLTGLGAQRIGTPLYHDAATGTLPEDVAVDWFDEWRGEQAVPAARSAA